MDPDKEKLSSLFLDIERESGTTTLNDAVLSALSAGIHDFIEKNEEDFFLQFKGVLELVKNTEPRISLVIDHLYHIWESLKKSQEKNHPHGHLYWERQILKSIDESNRINREEHEKLSHYGAKVIQKGDVILIHNRSRTVMDVLKEAKKTNKEFSVIIAEQETDKTLSLIDELDQYHIPFRVVPEYMLSHVEKEISKVFIGALTLNSEMNIVADAGTAAVVSEFHVTHVPRYLLLSTRKLSLWKARQAYHTYKVSTKKTHHYRPIEFERLKFSHDRVNIDLFTHVITEQGPLTPQELKSLYKKKFEERKDWRKEFMGEAA